MFLFLAILILSPYSGGSGWDLLSSVDLVRRYDSFFDQEVDVPVFSEGLKRHDGQTLSLEGFVIPLQKSEEQAFFILSRFPYQSCFFCGAAGPETVVEVYSKELVSLRDERVKVTGTLKLNASDPLHLYYLLKDCEVQVLK
ncbi:MAG: hypothetical protein KI790_09615 [Cyclobacteriaceae bacterium]|nr:hypothetical protein [Cyclobacteriaceae bacterium HetDA_MAG_MS6]